ncbi:MAG: PKD domain-containing protein, partial [Candidatus Hydromicrobium sp.]
LYTTIFFLLLLNFPKHISADAEKENNESKAKTEYSLLETKTDGDAQDTQDKDKDKEDTQDKDKDKEDKEDKNKKDDKENKKPEAKIEYSLLEGNIVVFDGSSSSDEDGTIVSYSWDFGDGSTGSGVTVTHTYNAPGNYKVTLTVTDDDGAYKKDVANIKLKNKDNNIENISESNEFTQSKEEEKKEDFKNLNNDLSKLNEKLVKSEEKSILIFNHLLRKLLNNKEDKIIEILDINVNSIGDLLNIEKIIKNYKVIAVIGFDEIIDLNYEKDIKQNKESVLTGKYPEFILNFWNNFKEFAALFN